MNNCEQCKKVLNKNIECEKCEEEYQIEQILKNYEKSLSNTIEIIVLQEQLKELNKLRMNKKF